MLYILSHRCVRTYAESGVYSISCIYVQYMNFISTRVVTPCHPTTSIVLERKNAQGNNISPSSTFRRRPEWIPTRGCQTTLTAAATLITSRRGSRVQARYITAGGVWCWVLGTLLQVLYDRYSIRTVVSLARQKIQVWLTTTLRQ